MSVHTSKFSTARESRPVATSLAVSEEAHLQLRIERIGADGGASETELL